MEQAGPKQSKIDPTDLDANGKVAVKQAKKISILILNFNENT